jgi:Tol biopolymer transport system component
MIRFNKPSHFWIMIWRSLKPGLSVDLALVLLLALFTPGCQKSPTETTPLLDPAEVEKIPFDRITGRIAFRRELASQNFVSHLLVIDGDQREMRAVVTFPNGVLSNLDWSPGGDWLVFGFFPLYGPWRTIWQVHMMPVTGESTSQLTEGPEHSSYPAWSPDGGRIAYWSERTGSSIWILDLETQQHTRLFGVSWSTRTRPAWSPDGQDLVVVSEDSLARATLYRVKLDSLRAMPIFTIDETIDQVVLKSPIFSPDGSKIAFVRFTVDETLPDRIWLIDADGSNPRQITEGPRDWNPAWSPDGAQILFSRNGDLFLVNADGSDLVQVTFSEAADEYPAWAE